MSESIVQLNEAETLPQGWQWVKLGEVCQFEYGTGLPEHDREKGDVPVYGSNGLVGYHTASITEGPAIVIGRKGSIGQVHYVSAACWPIDTTYYVDALRTSCDLNWLFLLLKWMRLDAFNRATGVPGLNRNDAYSQAILLPPVPEQKRIAAKVQELLKDVENARLACEARLEAAKALPQAYLCQVFESEEARQWERRRMGEVIHSLKNGIVTEQNFEGRGFKVTRIETISNGAIDPQKFGYVNLPVEDFEDFKLQQGDILFSHINSVERLGNSAIYDGTPENLFHGMNLLRIRVKSDILNPLFLLYWLGSDECKNYYITCARRAIGQASLNQADLYAISVLLPNLTTQQYSATELKSKISGAEKLKASIEKQLEAINVLPQAILRKAFSGEM